MMVLIWLWKVVIFMKINIIYPSRSIKQFRRDRFLKIMRWPFLSIAYISPIVNLIFGGVWWSIIVIAGVLMIWNLFFEVDLIEYNRISQFTKFVIYSCVMLFLIDIILIPGWMIEVLSIVSFSSLIVAGTLFFSDIERQKQNMMPLFILISLNVIGTIFGLALDSGKFYWTYIVMGSISVALVLSCVIVLGKSFVRQIVKRFHIK